jgi:hypothetical protein
VMYNLSKDGFVRKKFVLCAVCYQRDQCSKCVVVRLRLTFDVSCC